MYISKSWEIATLLLVVSVVTVGLRSPRIKYENSLLESGEILFSSNRSGGGRSIHKMNPSSVEIKQLTKNAIRGDNMVALSPDGKKLLFATYRFGGWKLGISNQFGDDIRRFSKGGGYETSASWSNNGKHVVYSKIDGPGRGFTKIFLADSEGNFLRKLTEANFHQVKPVFSPYDSKVLFEQYDYNSSGSKVADLIEHDLESGSNYCLTKNLSELAFAPSYSPDGSKVALLTVNDKKRVSLRIMDRADRSFQVLAMDVGLYPGGEDQFFMRTSWNNTGTRIVFSVYDGSDYELFIYSFHTKELVQMTNDSFDDVQPYWIK